jgi:hypothetical protein
MKIAGREIEWLDSDDIRPYMFVREHNRSYHHGATKEIDWFIKEPLVFSPMRMEEVHFSDQILALENLAFSHSNMEMPRWVFYDCAVMPGFVAGYAQRTSTLSESMRSLLKPAEDLEWTPISLFIIIPTMAPNEWVAHNLCSVNSLLPQAERFYGLGFLTKAFGLWSADVKICCGITQWKSPSIRLHSHYGHFEVLTAFTPVHNFSHTLTYRLTVDTELWSHFFTHEESDEFAEKCEYAGFEVDPDNEASLIRFQSKIEAKEAIYFLNSKEIRTQSLDKPLKVYKLIQTPG